MRKFLTLSAAFTVFFGISTAQAADGWGIAGEKVVQWDAKVVDVLCELSGDCPANCCDGKRQLGLSSLPSTRKEIRASF